FPTFAEMSVNLGFGLSPLSFSYLKTDDYKITEDFFFATIPFEFRYFPSKNAKFGFMSISVKVARDSGGCLPPECYENRLNGWQV
ncbi:MAG TPA: hypothetical protein PLV89_10925, partial [Treponemataceae bacterium]|nr:hypothetical protein [Treponemataceae bacterium]